MKYVLLIISCVFLSACMTSPSSEGVIEIVGARDGAGVVRGMGVCTDSSTVLTSAHVVRDDRVNYELRMSNYEGKHVNSIVIERDIVNDIAYMKVKDEEGIGRNLCSEYKKYIGKENARVGQSIYTPVMRSGSLMTLTGTITSLTGTVLAYDTLGRILLLSGVLMTDITTQPGDSGAPILDKEGRVVDVVHIQYVHRIEKLEKKGVREK